MNTAEILTRKELYELVWAHSLVALSKKYNLSDNGLRKICLRMSIPLPQAGRWAKLQHGKRVKAVPLPEKYEGEETVSLPLRSTDDPIPKGNPLKQLAQQIRKDKNLSFEVPERLHSKDPLIVAAKTGLTGKEAFGPFNYKGVLSCGSNELDIRVAPKNVSRSMRFMDSLLQLLRARGHEVLIKNGSTYAVVRDEEIKILLREKTKKVIVRKGTWDSTEYHPIDILSFRIDGYQGKEWKDGKSPLESFLPEILAKLELISDHWNEQKLYWQKQREIRGEQERIEKELQERKDKELIKFKVMLEKADRWHKAVNLRNYINKVERAANDNGGITSELQKWLDWARQKADWYDPFIETDDEMLEGINRKTLIP